MEVVYTHCCGLDLHKKSVVACRIVPGAEAQPRKEIRTFGTMTHELLALADWLAEAGVTHVAMESTGVYWKPVYNLLEESFTLLLVNASHMRAVPGRKTDVKDAEWIADLLRHGLLRASFVPPRPQRELRELTRYRASLVRERTAQINRLQKTLEGANIKLSLVASDITGVSGRQIVLALVEGQTDVAALAQLAKGRLREKIPQLEQALVGSFGAHQRFLVAQQLAHLEELETSIEAISQEVAKRLAAGQKPAEGSGEAGGEAPLAAREGVPSAKAAAVARLMTIPGVGLRTAETLVSEIGIEMSRFATARHLASWAGMAPGNQESAGKQKSGKTRSGNRWLRSILVEAGQAAGRTRETYLAALYQRVKGRRGKKKAAMAVGHAILVIAYHLLQRETTYTELGGNYFDERDREKVQRRLVRHLERLGHKVTLEPVAAT
jgi:transposase